MRKVTREIEYRTFRELTEQQQEAVLEARRDWHVSDSFWYEAIEEDVRGVATALGILIDKKGGFRFSGFWSQGDGASFTGDYRYRKNATKKIRANYPEDTELHQIADRLQKVQKRNFYQLAAEIRDNHSRYSHEMSVRIVVWRTGDSYADVKAADAEEIEDCLRDLMRWAYRALEREYEYRTSTEFLREWFTEMGDEYEVRLGEEEGEEELIL